MILAEHPISKYLAPHLRLDNGLRIYECVPAQLFRLALGVVTNCRKCEQVFSPLRPMIGDHSATGDGTAGDWLVQHDDCAKCSVLIDLDASIAAADGAIARSSDAVDDTWLHAARAAVLSVAASTDQFSTDDVWAAGLPKPREPRALGYVMRQLAQGGHIEPTGEFHRTAQVLRHHAPVALWRRCAPPVIDEIEAVTFDALCLKEPWLELILLGIKTLETRTKCMRKRSGNVVLTSSTIDQDAWDDPGVGGRLDEAGKRRAWDGLGKMRGLVTMGEFVPGEPGVDDAAACIGILLPDGRRRFVSRISNVRRLVEAPTMRISSYRTLVSGASQGFFRVPQSLVEMRS